jgi:hypothetical protein
MDHRVYLDIEKVSTHNFEKEYPDALTKMYLLIFIMI